MKRLRRSIGVLLIITAIIVMQLPVGTAEAADSVAFRYDGSTLLSYQGTDKTVTVPSDVTVIGSSAFEDNLSLEKVILPKSLRRIEPYAFWGCNALKEIQFGTGLKEIGDYSFTSCQGLASLVIPSNIHSIGIRAFADCVNLSSITIPATVTFIHETAFDGCKKLVIQCEEGSYADKYARDFYRRQAQMEEYEDTDVAEQSDQDGEAEGKDATVGQADDSGLLGSTSVVGNQAVILMDSRKPTVYQGAIAEGREGTYPVKYRIVDDEIIADQAYYKDRTLQEIVLPEGIREIGEFAFARCAAESLYLSRGVEKISFGAFYHADQLKFVQLADTVRKVEPQSFVHTPWLEQFLASGAGGQGDFLVSGGVLVGYRGTDPQVQIPEGVRVIAAECFKGMTDVQKVSFPETLTDIGEGAFEDCSALAELDWKNGLITIGDRAFAGCPLLDVTIPGTVKELGLGAFEEGTNIAFLGQTPDKTHEASAERLSNEAYRFAGLDASMGLKLGGSVLTLGMTGAKATLSGALRPYALRLSVSSEGTDVERAQKAMGLNIGKKLSTDAMQLSVSLTDESSIPITRLGKQVLTIEIPVPAAWEGKELEAYQYDRNGQLEPLACRYVRSGDQLMLLLETGRATDLVIQSTDLPLSEDRIEVAKVASEIGVGSESYGLAEENGASASQRPSGAVAVTPIVILKWCLGAILAFAGLFLALSKVKA